MMKEELIKTIKTAFSGVELGKGIGLWQAQAIDDYESEEIQMEKRAQDEKYDWSVFTSTELQRCHSSLSFFDADGMRFHLPAFILSSLNGGADDPLFHLTYLEEHQKSQFQTLDAKQVQAVIMYLKWCLNEPEYEFESPMIRRALNDHWEGKSNKAIGTKT